MTQQNTDQKVEGEVQEAKRVDTIVKLQRPLVTNDPDEPILIYNEDRSFELQVPSNSGLLELFGDEFKIYVNATIVETASGGQLLFHSKAEPQDW